MLNTAILFLFDHDDDHAYTFDQINDAVHEAWVHAGRRDSAAIAVAGSHRSTYADHELPVIKALLESAQAQGLDVFQSPMVAGVPILTEFDQVVTVAAFNDPHGHAAVTALTREMRGEHVIYAGEKPKRRVKETR